MEPNDFIAIVLPLASLVAILIIAVLYYAQKEEHSSTKLKYLRAKLEAVRKVFVQKDSEMEKTKAFNKEFDKLDELLKNNSIDQITYDRLKKLVRRAQLIESGYEHVTSDIDGKMYFRKRKTMQETSNPGS